MSTTIDEIEFRKFLEEVHESVAQKKDEVSSGLNENVSDVALAETMLEYLDEEGITTEIQLCPFSESSGRRLCAVSGYYLSEDEERLDIVLSKFVESGREVRTMSASEVAQLAGRAARFFHYAVQGPWNRFERHPETLDAARRIHASAKSLKDIRILILTNARVKEKSIEALKIGDFYVNFDLIDAERLYRISKSTTSRQDINIDFLAMMGRPLDCLEMTPRAVDYDTYLAIFPGTLLFKLYEHYGQRLFEFNVRSFLQAKGKVNKGIRDSLRDTPDRFMAYNNGIVATADFLDITTSEGRTAIARIVGLQIVNGAQTTASIYRAHKVEGLDISKVAVAVKITRVAPEKLQEFVPLISRFANTQNVIQVADLSANNEFHISMERMSQQVWCPGEESRWFYERARGSYQDALQRQGTTAAKRREFRETTPASQKISKTDLAKYLMAWMGRPHIVSMGAQKNFAVFMADLPEIFPGPWVADKNFYHRCIGQAILYRACERIVRSKKFPAYGANIVIYTYALLAHLCKGEFDFKLVWENQRISGDLEVLLAKWTELVDQEIRKSAGAKNVTEWCKKSACWDAVRSLRVTDDLAKIDELSKRAQEPTAGEAGQEDRATDDKYEEDLVEECMKHDAQTWAKLSFWGMRSGALDYVERGVAHTLSEYAASEWIKRPSPKQARVAVRVLEKARQLKIIGV